MNSLATTAAGGKLDLTSASRLIAYAIAWRTCGLASAGFFWFIPR